MAISLPKLGVLADDDEFVRVANDYPGYQFEREIDGTVVVSVTHTKGGAKSLAAAVQLFLYAQRAGGKAYDCDTGFAIGPGKRLYCPDASWVSQARIDAVPADKADGFWPISPDVAIEVKSDSDPFARTVEKIERYIERGSSYAVAIDPSTRSVIQLGSPPDGLVLDFDAIIDA